MAEQDLDAALGVVRSTSVPIHDIGTAIYLSKDVFAWAAEGGWSNPFAFYFAGRGAMLGDVDSGVVCAALGWFEPGAVAAMYDEGVKVAGAPAAAKAMSEAHGRWGEKHYAGVEGIDEIVAVIEEMVDGLEGSALPLFVGWRAAPRAGSAAGRAAQLMQILREWRGGLHLVATTAVGLSPLEAILTNEGPGQAKFFGWSEPFPDCESIKDKHDEAEHITDQLCAAGLAGALDAASFDAFEAGVKALRAATP
jgi:Helix-turn-helix family